MKDLCIEAYKFYKKTYANTVLLFHVGSSFESYNEDAIRLSQILKMPNQIRGTLITHSFSENELERVIQRLIDCSIPVHIIEYRDETGRFAIPKVNQISQDIIDDY